MASRVKHGSDDSEPPAVVGWSEGERVQQFTQAAPGLVLDLERIAGFYFERRFLDLPVEVWIEAWRNGQHGGSKRRGTDADARRARDDLVPSQRRFIAAFAERFATFEVQFGGLEIELAAVADMPDNCHASCTARFVWAARVTILMHAKLGRVPEPRDFPDWDWGGLRASVTRECARVMASRMVAKHASNEGQTPPLAPMPALGVAERKTLELLSNGPRDTAALDKLGSTKRARSQLRDKGFIEPCGSGGGRGVHRLTADGRTIATRIDAGE